MIYKRTRRPGFMVMGKAMGYLMILIGVVILVPLLCIPFWPEESSQMYCFAIPGVLSIMCGYTIKTLTAPYKVKTLEHNSGSVIVLLLWIVAILIAAVPFYLTGYYTPTQAIFESTSGLTTTGFTVTDYATATHMIFLYRAILQLVGGVGLILILTSIMSGVYGMQLFSAEGHLDRLEPTPLRSARTICLIYFSFIFAGTVLYTMFGMSIFDAICHSVSAVATGGFSTKPESLGYWHSVPIDITTIVLMTLGGTNFMSTLFLFRGKWKAFLCNTETILAAVLVAAFTPIVVVSFMVHNVTPNLLSAIDNALFHVVSIMTTTGLTTVDYFAMRSGPGALAFLILMMVGCNSGSTAGGIKTYRLALAIKSAYWDVREIFIPTHQIRSRKILRYNEKITVTKKQQSENFTYIFLYINIMFTGSFLLMCCGYNFEEAFLEFTSALSTVGVGSNIANRTMEAPGLWIIIVGMLIARLEIFIFLFTGARTYTMIKNQVNHFGDILRSEQAKEKERDKARRAELRAAKKAAGKKVKRIDKGAIRSGIKGEGPNTKENQE